MSSISSQNIQKIGKKLENNLTKQVSMPNETSVQNIFYRPVIKSFHKASDIKKAMVVNPFTNDVLLSKTKNGGYIVEQNTQTELIYGNDAINYLKKTNRFDSDTQIAFPNKTFGTLYINGKEIPIKENSAILLNKGSKAKVVISQGYPQILMTRNDMSWYKKYSLHRDEKCLKDKFNDLVFNNAHTYNGEFKKDIFSSDKNKNSVILEKLKENDFIQEERSNYFKFKKYYNWDYQKNLLAEKGFDNEELNIIEPVYKQLYQTKIDTKLTLKTEARFLSENTVQKLKDRGILYNNKTHTDKIFWKQNYENENHLKDVLKKNNILGNEQKKILKVWNNNNKIGYDITGLKYINNNVAIYCLDDKVNNVSMEKSCWLTNSTALSSNKKASSCGISIVQTNQKEPIEMSKLRKGEQLHLHPEIKGEGQTEIYLITNGTASLTIVRNGVPQIKVLREGDLVVIPPNTPHCVNSVMGDYEQIVSQVPSAFQYGTAFKQVVDFPEGYDRKEFEKQAKQALVLN